MRVFLRNVLPAVLFVVALVSALDGSLRPLPALPPADAANANAIPADPAAFVEASQAGFSEETTDPSFVRFVALGDSGKGNDRQFRVAEAIRTTCEARGGCSFALLLGDNIYPSGPESIDDPAFAEKFEKPYEKLPFPFWATLGNHDCGGNGNGLYPDRGQHEVAYTRKSRKWRMPAPTYAFVHGPAEFISLDTNALYLADFAGPFAGSAVEALHEYSRRAFVQRTTIRARLAAMQRPWKFVFGHHPYLSNGVHGDAGSYDGVPTGLPGSGLGFRDFFRDVVCGKADVYLSGHDHSLQDQGPSCGVQVFVSGGGASSTRIAGERVVPFAVQSEGFLLVEASKTALDFTFVDGDGKTLHTRHVDAVR